VLPPRLKTKLGDSALMAPDFHVSERVVHPLGLAYWGQSWTLTAWCEMRNGFRNFRLDRIDGLEILRDRFESEPGRTLADFLALMAAERVSAKA
jgi:predicted DNA-binding transcriptional regulator YafY